MSINPKSQGVTIIVDELGIEFHSIDDWGLYVSNNDYIGTPVLYTKYIEVPGSNKMLDVSQALTGRRTYKSRPISVDFGRVHPKIEWDAVISNFRNNIDGRIVRLIFDNDPNYYWIGRCQITDFDRVMTLGTFKLKVPDADPFKYSVQSNVDPWLWDPFDFENDIVPEEPVIEVNGSASITVPKGTMYTCPEFTVTGMTTPIVLKFKNRTYTLKSGYNYFPALMIGGDEEITLNFAGVGRVLMEYRGGSL